MKAHAPVQNEIVIMLTDGEQVANVRYNILGVYMTPTMYEKAIEQCLRTVQEQMGGEWRLATKKEFFNEVLQERHNTGMTFAIPGPDEYDQPVLDVTGLCSGVEDADPTLHHVEFLPENNVHGNFRIQLLREYEDGEETGNGVLEQLAGQRVRLYFEIIEDEEDISVETEEDKIEDAEFTEVDDD